MNALGKFFTCVICVIVMFYYPLMYSAEKQDAITQIYITTEVSSFTDNIRNHGYLSPDMYYRFIRKIDVTGNLYNIQIVHSRRIVEPVYDDNLTFLDDYDIHFIDTYEDEILEKLENGEVYKFSEGDNITVKVSNRNSTLASKLKNAFSFNNNENAGIVVSYGGMIRDEID